MQGEWSAVTAMRTAHGDHAQMRSEHYTIRRVAAAALLVVLAVTVISMGTSVDTRSFGLAASTISSSLTLSSVRGEVDQLADATPSDRFDPVTKGAQCYACKGGFMDSGSKKDSYHVARLVGTDNDGSRSLCGRAEVWHGGRWGSICYEGWTTTDAQVFCRTMGLTGGTARYNDGLKPTWDDTAVTHTAPLKPPADTIWMDEVSCAGTETNIMDCPFGGKAKGDPAAWIDYGKASVSNCDHTGDVGLCCDVSQFCPERSRWRPDQHDYVYQKQMFMANMKPDQGFPEIVANCKCDAGFYMIPSGVYGGRCEECMENACSPVGSSAREQCYCLPGFFMSDGECLACPDNSCSRAGSTSVDSCTCFEGYYFNSSGDAAECTSCPMYKTSKRGSTSEGECSYDCGLPPAPTVLGAEISALSGQVDAAESKRQTAMRNFEDAVKAKDDAVQALNKQLALDLAAQQAQQDTKGGTPPPTAADNSGDLIPQLTQSVTAAEEARHSAEEAYRAAGEDKASLLREMERKIQEKHHQTWVYGNQVTECHPMKGRCQGKCRGTEPSNPCEPWPSCYPKPCSPWPGCMYGPQGLHTANLPRTDEEWRSYEEGRDFPQACTPKYEGLVQGWSFDCSEKLAKAREAILAEASKAAQANARAQLPAKH